MEILGKVIQIMPFQEGVSKSTGNPWKSQQFIIETQEQYPRKVAIELYGEDRIKNNPYEVDQIVKVSFDLESREFNGRWYTSVRAWKVEVVNSTPAETTAVPQAYPVSAPAPSELPQSDGQSDLPF